MANQNQFEKGQLLVAEPSILNDECFARSVVLITHVDQQDVVGFILNKKSDYNLKTLIPGLNTSFQIYKGGPVDEENLYFIHTIPDLIPDSLEIKDGIYWGGNFENIVPLINDGIVNHQNTKFFLGYTGWFNLQLKDEIQQKTWIIDEFKQKSNLFQTSLEGEYWQNKLKSLGGEYLIWSNAPGNPSNN